MKRKFSLSAVLLFITGLLLIVGIFFIGIQTRGQLLDTRKQFETFVSQIDKEQYTLTEAQASFDTAIQSKKDLLNYYEKKSSPKQPAVQEHMDSDESSSDVPTSVFSQVN